MENQIIQNQETEALLGKIPNHIYDLLKEENPEHLLEIVLDLGRPIEARFLDKTKIFQEILLDTILGYQALVLVRY